MGKCSTGGLGVALVRIRVPIAAAYGRYDVGTCLRACATRTRPAAATHGLRTKRFWHALVVVGA
jgi:hypothetical protein